MAASETPPEPSRAQQPPAWIDTGGAPQLVVDAIEAYTAAEFGGLLGQRLTVRDWLGTGDRFAVHWFVEGTHGSPGEFAQPSTFSSSEFLGWQATGADVGVHVASFRRVLATGELGWTHEWDRLHGLFQIGVHAVGRPIVRGAGHGGVPGGGPH